MDFREFRRILAIGVPLCFFPLATNAVQEIPSIEAIHDLVEAREAALTYSISAKYSVRVKRLPGKNEWLRYCVDNHSITAPSGPYLEDNAMEFASDCRLELNGAMLKLALVDPRDPGHEEDYQTDGSLSWLYVPEKKGATLRVKAISPKTFGEERPWLPAYLTTFPSSMVAASSNGPTLSALLSPAAGNKIHMEVADGGDLILEVRSPIAKTDAGDHDLVRKITLGRNVGYVPTRYIAYIQVGSNSFPPDVDARYEDFVRDGAIQTPRRIVIRSSRGERVHGKAGDPLKPSDFKTFQIEELTAVIDELKIAPILDVGSFAFKVPPGTKVFDMYSGQQYTTKNPADSVEKLGEEAAKLKKPQ
ncbi:MAG: hypothetical protein P4L99_19815 [Chthoniobacter sp.]|nr:hypothetical protein [Chthoniobacter sp.]